MQVIFSSDAWDDFQHWQNADEKKFERIKEMIKETRRNPTGKSHKAERLKGDLSGYSSKRIDQEHRMVYRIKGAGPDQALEIIQLRHHY